MNIKKTLPIVIGVIAVFLVAIYFFGPKQEKKQDDDITPDPDPIHGIEEIKRAIDAAASIDRWDLSSVKDVEEQLDSYNRIKEAIDSDLDVGLIKASDANDLTIYYQNMLSKQLDKGILQFFKEADYNTRGSLYPIYKSYRDSMPESKKQGESAFPIALQYYIVSGILRRDVGEQVDSIRLSDAKGFLEKIERAKKSPVLVNSDVFKTLENNVRQAIGEKVVVTYRNKAERFFSNEFNEAEASSLQRSIDGLEGSVLGRMKSVTYFIGQTEEKLEIFPDCPKLLASRDTTNLCQFCQSFAFYKSYCDN